MSLEEKIGSFADEFWEEPEGDQKDVKEERTLVLPEENPEEEEDVTVAQEILRSHNKPTAFARTILSRIEAAEAEGDKGTAAELDDSAISSLMRKYAPNLEDSESEFEPESPSETSVVSSATAQPQQERVVQSQQERVVQSQQERVVQPQQEKVVQPQQERVAQPQQERVAQPQQERVAQPRQERVVQPQQETFEAPPQKRVEIPWHGKVVETSQQEKSVPKAAEQRKGNIVKYAIFALTVALLIPMFLPMILKGASYMIKTEFSKAIAGLATPWTILTMGGAIFTAFKWGRVKAYIFILAVPVGIIVAEAIMWLLSILPM